MNRRTAIAGILAIPFVCNLIGRGVLAANVPPLMSGKGLIVFYRPRRMKGGAQRFLITRAGLAIGDLANGTMMTQYVDPGQYVFEVNSFSVDGRDAINVFAADRQTQFIRADFIVGYPTWRAKFSLMAEAQGHAEVSKM